MIITTTVEETRRAIVARNAKRIGLVPTMGALHAGHASLIAQARRECDFVAVSIFVNPTQFGPKEDLARYPRPFEADVEMCRRENVDLIFHPTPAVMYPLNSQSFVEVSELQKVLCGRTRPSHFRGVATVVLKLFNIIQPHVAYFGQKDAQQVRVLQQMVRDLDVPVEIVVCLILREPDGLAMSSRNVYLDAEQRRNATVLSRTLQAMRTKIEAGERDADSLIRLGRGMIEATPGTRIDYLSIVDFERLQPVDQLKGEILIALAVFFGPTRLIDNMLMQVSEPRVLLPLSPCTQGERGRG